MAQEPSHTVKANDVAALTAAAIELAGLWRFQPDAYEDGERLGYQEPDLDLRCWCEVAVPCAFDD